MKRQALLIALCLSAPGFESPVAQTCWRPFSDESPWNQKIPVDARADSLSDRWIDDLSKGDFVVNMEDWSIPVYFIDADSVPKVNVLNSRPGVYGRGFAEPNRIPVLPEFVASPPVGDSSDNHLCIIDTAKMIEWDMWAARKNRHGLWTTGLGAVTDLRSSGVEKPWFEQEREFDAHRSRASGFPLVAGLIRPDEIRAGRIEHALVFAYQRGRSEFFVPPASTAQATINEMDNRFGIPMGGRIQLDPSLNVDSLDLNAACKIIAKALQEYGAFNGDYAGATVLYADNSPSAMKQWRGVLRKDDLLRVFTAAFVRQHFRVLDIGTLFPGQNLKNGQAGFLDFRFPGVLHVSIDRLQERIECSVARGVDLARVTPAFTTVKRNATVFLGRAKQQSGKSSVDLTHDAQYRIDVPGGESRVWTVSARQR